TRSKRDWSSDVCSSDLGVSSDVYSVTSFTELAREGNEIERYNTLHPEEEAKVPYITKVMNDAPAIAATDYMRLFADQVRAYVPRSEERRVGKECRSGWG